MRKEGREKVLSVRRRICGMYDEGNRERIEEQDPKDERLNIKRIPREQEERRIEAEWEGFSSHMGETGSSSVVIGREGDTVHGCRCN